ncbi:hypothetical protein GGQ85_003162 [Nitrobacter vulgaris]|nr:hypothetical protein [Nitrobacter vulgaris]
MTDSHPLPSLRAKRSNPVLPRSKHRLDCFVTNAPRNDGTNVSVVKTRIGTSP